MPRKVAWPSNEKAFQWATQVATGVVDIIHFSEPWATDYLADWAGRYPQTACYASLYETPNLN